jgi:hypothetical protein
MSSPTDESPVPGPICPNCRQPLRENLLHEHTVARDSSGGEPLRAVSITYCGRCGWTLSVDAARRTFVDADGPGRDEIIAPPDPMSLAGQFQLYCHVLVDEIEHLGFAPRGWISLVNQLGAVEAARHLLAENRVLPVTEWLVDQGHGELTMEHSLTDPKWHELFTDAERVVAAGRLERIAAQDKTIRRRDPS